MGLEGNEVERWNNFVNMLEINFINFDEEDQDKLIWTRNSTNGDYTTKKGYEMAILDQTEGHKAWCWGVLWASNCPLKTTLTFWLEIYDKSLTWKNLRKRGFQGPGFCSLCKSGEELTSHLFGSCTYAGQVWNNASHAISQERMDTMEGNLEQRAKTWWEKEVTV